MTALEKRKVIYDYIRENEKKGARLSRGQVAGAVFERMGSTLGSASNMVDEITTAIRIDKLVPGFLNHAFTHPHFKGWVALKHMRNSSDSELKRYGEQAMRESEWTFEKPMRVMEENPGITRSQFANVMEDEYGTLRKTAYHYYRYLTRLIALDKEFPGILNEARYNGLNIPIHALKRLDMNDPDKRKHFVEICMDGSVRSPTLQHKKESEVREEPEERNEQGPIDETAQAFSLLDQILGMAQNNFANCLRDMSGVFTGHSDDIKTRIAQLADNMKEEANKYE